MSSSPRHLTVVARDLNNLLMIILIIIIILLWGIIIINNNHHLENVMAAAVLQDAWLFEAATVVLPHHTIHHLIIMKGTLLLHLHIIIGKHHPIPIIIMIQDMIIILLHLITMHLIQDTLNITMGGCHHLHLMLILEMYGMALILDMQPIVIRTMKMLLPDIVYEELHHHQGLRGDTMITTIHPTTIIPENIMVIQEKVGRDRTVRMQKIECTRTNMPHRHRLSQVKLAYTARVASRRVCMQSHQVFPTREKVVPRVWVVITEV